MDFTAARPNRRNGRRWNVMWPGLLVVEGRGYGCTILDLSHSGARIDCYGLPPFPGVATLQCEQFGGLEARLAWIRNGQAGLRFALTEAEVIDRLKVVVPGIARREGPRPAQPKRATFGRLRAPAPA